MTTMREYKKREKVVVLKCKVMSRLILSIFSGDYIVAGTERTRCWLRQKFLPIECSHGFFRQLELLIAQNMRIYHDTVYVASSS